MTRLLELRGGRESGNLWKPSLGSFAEDNIHYFNTWHEDMTVDQFASCIRGTLNLAALEDLAVRRAYQKTNTDRHLGKATCVFGYQMFIKGTQTPRS